MPSQTFTHTATASAQVEEVWRALQQPKTWESIGGVDRVFDPAVDAQGRLVGFSFESVAGGKRYVGEATPHRREEGRLMAWQVRTSEVRGVTIVALTPRDEHTEIAVTLQVESAGFLSAVFFPVIVKAIGGGLPGAVDGFAAELSNGG